ncbi:MAG: hypothetical protein DWQ04_21945 [Chloroflexi bacterium]|nr:MAG: hypothetical protein DWQ04_21945 [Chloroflexota bacterium]
MAKFEEQYNDTLRSLELALVRVYRKNDAVVDWHVGTAVNNLTRIYTAEQRKRKQPSLKMPPQTQQAFTNLQIACEGWLGRAPLFDEVGQISQLDQNNLTIAEIIACLKRIRRSIDMWQKEGGRRGYFEFIDQFLPE